MIFKILYTSPSSLGFQVGDYVLPMNPIETEEIDPSAFSVWETPALVGNIWEIDEIYDDYDYEDYENSLIVKVPGANSSYDQDFFIGTPRPPYCLVVRKEANDLNLTAVFLALQRGKKAVILAEIAHFDLSTQKEGVWYLSNTGFISSTTDEPANTPYLEYLNEEDEFNIQIEIPNPNEEFTLAASTSSGKIVIENANNFRDTWLYDYVVDGRKVSIFLGTTESNAKSKFVQIGKYLALSLEASGDNLTLTLRSLNLLLEKPLQTKKFTTATVIGADAPQETLYPILYGSVANISPLERKKTEYLPSQYHTAYQYSDSNTEHSLIQFFDKGIMLNTGTNYDDFKDDGGVGILIPNDGLITAAIDEEKVGEKPINILKDVFTRYGLSTDNVDMLSLEIALSILRRINIGCYVTEEITLNDFLNKFLQDCFCSKYWNWLGKMSFHCLLPFEYEANFLTNRLTNNGLEYVNVDMIKPAGVSIQAVIPPSASIKMGGMKNWTVMSDSDFASSVSSYGRFVWKSEYFKPINSAYLHTNIQISSISWQTGDIVKFTFGPAYRQNLDMRYKLPIEAGCILEVKFEPDAVVNPTKTANIGKWEVIETDNIPLSNPNDGITDYQYNWATVNIPGATAAGNDETFSGNYLSTRIRRANKNKTAFPQAQELEIKPNFSLNMGALNIASIIHDIFCAEVLIKFSVDLIGIFPYEVGNFIQLSYPDYGLQDGKKGQVIGVEGSFTKNQMSLTVLVEYAHDSTPPPSGGGWNIENVNITSPDFPSEYPENFEEVIETITKAGASKIKLHFVSFQTESGWDYLSIRDSGDNELQKLTGNLGSDFFSNEFTVSTLKLFFSSDYSVVGEGFQIDEVHAYY